MSEPAQPPVSAESAETASEAYTVQLNASVALKLANIGETSASNTTICGPIYGFDGVESGIISVTHTIPFPVNGSGDDFFLLRSGNSKFQTDYLEKLRGAKITANLLGWFVSSPGGKNVSQSLLEALYALQQVIKNNKRDIPALLVVYDPLKSTEGYLNLKSYKLSDPFLKTIVSENKFIAKNLIDNKLSHKNLLEELPVAIKSNHLINLKVQELDLSNSDNLSIKPSTYNSIKISADQLNDAVHHLNHCLGNFNYFQRNMSRDIAKINKWEAKIEEENDQLLKSNPNAKIQSPDWKTEFKLMPPSSKYEYLVASNTVNSICNNLQTTETIELVKATGVKDSLAL